jgi:BlaI family transcriptional regulator, penicillinase repressor
MNNEIPELSDAEWEVMKIIWMYQSVTANKIIEELKDKTDWKPKTIKTLINRLLNKKAINYTQNNREYIYTPVVTESECRKEENKTFLKRVYDGTLKTMLVNFIEQNELTKDEIEELKQLLDERREKK